MSSEIQIRECSSIEDFETCIALQREAFGLPDIEVSPRRHFIVSHCAGGWTLGAFSGGRMVGFVHHLVAIRGNDEIIGYSHMMSVARDFQNQGIGAILKWAQRKRAIAEGRRFIKWTWDPMQSRNAHFNLNRLGVCVRAYAINFYGTGYSSARIGTEDSPGIDSDRLFAEWELDSDRVNGLASSSPVKLGSPEAEVVITPAWQEVVESRPFEARQEQLRVREEFRHALSMGLVCKAFERDAARPRYLFYRDNGAATGPDA
jgi:predicted GNAT superfamily acetyltransferase